MGSHHRQARREKQHVNMRGRVGVQNKEGLAGRELEAGTARLGDEVTRGTGGRHDPLPKSGGAKPDCGRSPPSRPRQAHVRGLGSGKPRD